MKFSHAITTALTLLLALLWSASACQGGSPPPPPGSWSADSEEPLDYKDDPLMPADHDVDWIRRHGAMSLGQGDDCAVCHAENDCIECHVESLDEPYAVHPPNFEVVHAVDAQQGVQDCTSCHRLDTFCEACHVEAGVSPRLDAQPPTTVDFHPPDWLDSAAPENHGVMARRDINDCASCHIEQDCITCHVGINPHPPEFRFDCGPMLETNPAPCAQCHTENPEYLRQLCL